MRGKGFSAFEFYVDFGITPAYAGKSSYTTAAESEENRITPAYAGKSSNTRHSFFPRWDHPRLCGEKHGTFI